MEFPYVKVKNGQSQYADIDLRTPKAVEARYVKTKGFEGNPFVEALPQIQHIYVRNDTVPPSAAELHRLSSYQREMLITRITDFRTMLPFYDDLAYELRRTMLEAYSAVGGKHEQKKRVSRSREKANNGFALLGIPGSGKTCAVNENLEQYPQTIIHHINGDVCMQLPYLYIPGVRNAGLHELYKAIGKAVDIALDNGNHAYEEEIENLRNLEKESECIVRLLENFHVGIVILDEVQNVVSDRKHENSLDTMISICNESNTGICVIGTEDSFYELFGENSSGRISDLIVASGYCQNYDETRRIVKELFSLGYIDDREPREEVILAFYQICGGVIEYLVRLYYYIAKRYAEGKETPALNAVYVKMIANMDLRIFQRSVARLLKSTDLEQIQRRRVISDMEEYVKKQKRRVPVVCNPESLLGYLTPADDKDAILPERENDIPINTEVVLYKLLAPKYDDEDEEY